MGGLCGKEDDEKKNEPEKPGMLSRTPWYEAKHLFTIGMTVACMALAIDAYIELSAYTSDVQDILENWKTKPIIDAYVSNYSVACLDGFSEFKYSNSDFSGVSKGHCGCSTAAIGYSSTYANCTDYAEASLQCYTAPSIDSVSAKAWRREKICIRRGGEASVSFKDGYARRPYPDENGNCPNGYKKCGAGTYEDDRTVCFPDTEKCPITGLLVAATQPTGGSWIYAGNFTHDGMNLYYRREYPDELPAVDLDDALTRYSGDYQMDNYNGKDNERGPCYMGGPQRYGRDVDVSDEEFAKYTIKAPTSCEKPDPRFVLYDRVEIDDHFLGVLDQSGKCVGFQIYSTTDSRFNAANDPDYLQSSVPCGTHPYTCSLKLNTTAGCYSTDQVCDLVFNQNVCGQYVQAVRGVGGKAETFGLYRRSEILWSPDCEVDREAIYTNKDPLQAALQAQLAVVVVGCIFGAFAGIFWPVALLTVLRKEFCNVVNYKVTIMDRADPWIHLIKVIPLIPSIYYVGKIYRLFATAGEDDCSDPTSNETFDFLAKTLPSIFQKSISNILLEGLMMIAGIYFYRQKVKKAEKHSAGKVVPEETLPQGNNQPPAQQPVQQMGGFPQQQQQQQPVYQMGGYPQQQQQPAYGYQMAPQGYPPQQQQPYGMVPQYPQQPY